MLDSAAAIAGFPVPSFSHFADPRSWFSSGSFLQQRESDFAGNLRSIDWFKGKITGKSHISWENLWFPVDFPLSQSIDWYLDGAPTQVAAI